MPERPALSPIASELLTRAKLAAAWESSTASMGVGPWLYATELGLAIALRRPACVLTDPDLRR